MVELLWKVNLPAGRVASVSEYGAYLVEANESKKCWTTKFTHFPSDADRHSIPACPKRRFATWEKACLACATHALACSQQPARLRA